MEKLWQKVLVLPYFHIYVKLLRVVYLSLLQSKFRCSVVECFPSFIKRELSLNCLIVAQLSENTFSVLYNANVDLSNSLMTFCFIIEWLSSSCKWFVLNVRFSPAMIVSASNLCLLTTFKASEVEA